MIDRLDHLVLTTTDETAAGPLRSVYLRDPDLNRVELSEVV